jgi:hypothetical protein
MLYPHKQAKTIYYEHHHYRKPAILMRVFTMTLSKGAGWASAKVQALPSILLS